MKTCKKFKILFNIVQHHIFHSFLWLQQSKIILRSKRVMIQKYILKAVIVNILEQAEKHETSRIRGSIFCYWMKSVFSMKKQGEETLNNKKKRCFMIFCCLITERVSQQCVDVVGALEIFFQKNPTISYKKGFNIIYNFLLNWNYNENVCILCILCIKEYFTIFWGCCDIMILFYNFSVFCVLLEKLCLQG